MSNENPTNRTQLTDLPVTEQEMTAEEMENVLGGKVVLGSWPQVAASPVTTTIAPTTTVGKEPPLAAATTVKGTKSNSDN